MKTSLLAFVTARVIVSVYALAWIGAATYVIQYVIVTY